MHRVFIPIALLAILLSAAACSASGKDTEAVTVAQAQFESTALLCIALDQQLFSRHGLDVSTLKYDTGVGALEAVLDGSADIAVGPAEFPLVRSAFENKQIRAFAIIDRAEFIYLIGRKDHGITDIADLKGKMVGAAPGTIAEFYLGRLLTLNGMHASDIRLVKLATRSEWVNAIVDGDVDAVVVAEPQAGLIRRQLGPNAAAWSAQSSQPQYILAIASQDWISRHPERIRRFLTALAAAEEYLIRYPLEARTIVQEQFNLEASYMDSVWEQNQFSLFLDQALILAMEDEARWMIQNNLTPKTQIPDFGAYIYTDGLKAVKPLSVRIFP